MSTLKKSQVVMLPTKVEAPSFTKNHIVKCIKEWTPIGEDLIPLNRLSFSVNHSEGVLNYYEAQHLYFLSDEETKGEECWHYNHIFKTISKEISTGYKKIIATTDTSLKITKELDIHSIPTQYIESDQSFPQPSQSFIEKFIENYNKGNIISDVMVEYKITNEDFSKTPVQVTIDLKTDSKNTITIKRVKELWNREEMVNKIHEFSKQFVANTNTAYKQKDINDWIEQNL